MSITKDEFRAALGRFASGVTVITTIDRDRRLHGITVSAFCSVSLSPPLISICIEHQAGSHAALLESDSFVVNILSEEQQHYSDVFASHLPNKFDGIEFMTNKEGLPILKDTLASLECKKVNAYEAGDHTIFIGEIIQSFVLDGKPLVYFHGGYQKIT